MRRRLSVKRLTKGIRMLIPETGCCTPKKEQFVVLREQVGGRARVIMDEDRVLQGG